MDTNTFVIIVIFASFFIGIMVGFLFLKIKTAKENKKLIKNAQEVLEGKRENKININGEEYDANDFVLRDKEGNLTKIDLKGGGIIKDGETKEISREENIGEEIKDHPNIRENSISPRRKKRFAKRRNGILRRFG